MDVFTIILILFTASSASSISSHAGSSTFNVLDYGAVGDGKTDDTQPFNKAWEAVCGAATSDTPTLVIPVGKTFSVKCLEFQGPCTSSNVHVQVLGNLVAPTDASAYTSMDKWLGFEGVNGLIMDGSGQIDGQGSAWWSGKDGRNGRRPAALLFHNCNGLQLSGVKLLNPPRNHISINGCNGVTVSHINLTAPKDSPNTDGIDISTSTHIQIQDSYIGTGDDCVAINTGSSYINITNVACGPGHGISVGSLGEGGAHDTVEEVHVRDCSFVGTENGARIKTWQGGSGYARKISFEQITLTGVDNPIFIDQYYCNGEHNCPNQTSAVQVSDVTYSGVYGSSEAELAINLSCSQSVACTNIVFDGINITSAIPGKETSAYCLNAHGTSKETIPAIPCLS